MIIAEEFIGPEKWHGTPGGTTNHKCKCLACRTVWAQKVAQERRERAERIDPADPRHGKATFYQNHGCRCIPCCAANTAQRRDWLTRKKVPK